MTIYKINYYSFGGSTRESKDSSQMLDFIAERFNSEFEKILGVGGHGIVLKVTDTKDGIPKAYKNTNSALTLEVEEKIRLLQDLPLGIGLTKIYEVYTCHPWTTNIMTLQEYKDDPEYAKYLFFVPVYTIEEMKGEISSKDIQKIYMVDTIEKYEDIFNNKYGGNGLYYNIDDYSTNVQIMELLDGDVKTLKEKENFEQTDFDKMLSAITLNIFELLFRIKCADSYKPDNKFVKTISEGEEINGVNLSNYAYWHLRLGGTDYYFPSQKHIVKLGDYEWQQKAGGSTENLMEEVSKMLDLPLSTFDNVVRVIDRSTNTITETLTFGLDITKYEEYKVKPEGNIFSFVQI